MAREFENTALIMVDPQKDFCPGGKLAVKDGDQVITPLNKVGDLVLTNNGLVIATRDWHPAQTSHFDKYGGIWPEHCVQGTEGAKFHPRLDLAEVRVFSKGMRLDEDAYSGFEARDPKGDDLDTFLKGMGVRKLLVGGLATDYCVKATVLDALDKGFETFVLEDAIKAVNLKPWDETVALAEMRLMGAKFTTSQTFAQVR